MKKAIALARPPLGKKPVLALLILVQFAAMLEHEQVIGAQPGVVFTNLYSFSGGNDGLNPQAGLVQGSDGNFYGTTFNGGTNSSGTVFKISPNGKLTSLYSFTGADDGASPAAGLVQGNDGNFYGTTQSGGKPASGGPAGTVFKISPNGVLTNLYSFTDSFSGGNEGASPEAGLMLGSDGNFYGTTFQGGTYFFSNSGTNGYGTVFKITTNGILTSLHPFSATDGANPAAGLVQGTDGNFYGTTQSGGLDNFGTVFKIDTNGVLTTLYSFSGGNDGAGPLATLVQGSDGYLYGTTANGGGTQGAGTVFKISTSGAFTNLYTFTGGADGGNPYAGLTLGSDGNFYGTTQSGGTNGGEGTVFKISPTGSFTSVYTFTGGNDGSNPQAGLVQGSDGNLYGTTFGGGQGFSGTVFRLSVPLGPPKLAILPAGTNVVLSWMSTASGYVLQSTTNLVSSVWTTNSPAPVVVNGQYTVTNPISGAQHFFRLSQ